MRKLLLLSVLTGVLAAGAQAQEPVTLKRIFKQGESIKYSLSMQMSVLEQEAILYTAKVEEKVVEATEQSITLEYIQTDFKASVFGDEVELPENQTSLSYIFEPSGRLLDVKAPATDTSPRIAAFWMLPLPSKPVAVSDTWVLDVKEAPSKGIPAGKYEMKLEGQEMLQEEVCAVISVQYREIKMPAIASSTSKFWLGLTSGKVLKMESQWSRAPMPGASEVMDGKIIYERIKPE